MSLVSLVDMKTYLEIPALDTTYDVFLQDQLDVVSAAVEGYCARKFETGSYVQTFYKDELEKPQKELLLYHYPIQTITSVVEDGEAITDYRVLNNTGKIVRPNKFLIGEELAVTYNAGFTDIPLPVVSTVRTLVEENYNKKVSGVALNFGSDIQGISIPGTISIQYDYTLQSNERANAYGMILGNHANVLDLYRSERAVIGTIGNQYV
jgi:hypothetical protein|tara:strand:- start:5161 stop:5784 length:624 start_codon:yes stop_codon:yes gene_type:complete